MQHQPAISSPDLIARDPIRIRISHPGVVALWCCLLLSPLWIVTMFGRGLWTPDEPREADISWRMSMQHDLAVPTLAGRPFLEKPPLTYWVAGGFATLFPDRDAPLRAPNLVYAAIATFAVVLLAFAADGVGAAFVAGFAFGSCALVLQIAAWLATDAAMMSGVALALLGLYRGVQASASRTKLAWYLLMHVGLALAFMAKGPAAWLVPGLAAAGFFIVERNWRELRRWQLWVGAVVPALTASTWALAVALEPNGLHELSVMLWSNVTGRVVSMHTADALAYSQSHRNWPGKYFVELPYYVLPWTFLLVAALRRARHAVRESEGAPWRFALCALVLPLIALSLARTGRGIYAAPVMPAAALLVGLWAAQALARPDRFDRRMMAATVWLVAILVAVLFAATGFIVDTDPGATPFRLVALVGAVAAAVAVSMALYSLRRHSWQWSLATAFAAFAIALLTVAVSVFPAMDRWQDIASVVRAVDVDTDTRRLALYAPDETILAVVDRTLRGRRPHVARPGTIEEAAALLERPQPVAFLVRLRGHGEGAVTRRLRSLGVMPTRIRPSALPDELDVRLGLSIERTYELPQGRRYALLSRRKVARKTAHRISLIQRLPDRPHHRRRVNLSGTPQSRPRCRPSR